MTLDKAALARLMAYTETAIAEQDPHVADQLHAALAAGKTSVQIVPADDATFAEVEVDGYRVCRVDVRNLVPLDDAL